MMLGLRQILVPLDGSELAERALGPAAALARAQSACLILFRAVPPLPLTIKPRAYRKVTRWYWERAAAYLKAVQARLSREGINGEAILVEGEAAQTIIAYACQQGIDLIIMSSHGRSGIGRWLLGSVAEKVVHYAPCPTLVLRAKLDIPDIFSRILVPLDGSLLAEQALAPACLIAQTQATTITMNEPELVLLRVCPTFQTGVNTMPLKEILNDLERQEQHEALLYLDRVQAAVANKGVPIHIEVRSGSVAETILDFTRDRRMDLIVICSHGRSGADLWLRGSVATKVLHHAPCALLIVPENREKLIAAERDMLVTSVTPLPTNYARFVVVE